jgi:hypothetical protein
MIFRLSRARGPFVVLIRLRVGASVPRRGADLADRVHCDDAEFTGRGARAILQGPILVLGMVHGRKPSKII